jgi:hypothetical protein
MQSGLRKIGVMIVFCGNGNMYIYNYDKLVEKLNSLINQINLPTFSLAKGCISMPQIDIPTPKIPD